MSNAVETKPSETGHFIKRTVIEIIFINNIKILKSKTEKQENSKK